MNAEAGTRFELEVATLTDVGTEREHNEDHCGELIEAPGCGLLVVADGVSSAEAGETASHTAVDATLKTFREQPAGTATPKRLYRAVQQANIEVYDLATVVPELRGMTTTLTAVVVDRGEGDAVAACRTLVDTANQRGTLDNLTAAVLRVLDGPDRPDAPSGFGDRLRALFGRRG